MFKVDSVQFHNSKVGFLASVRMTWLFRPDAHQTSNIRQDDMVIQFGLSAVNQHPSGLRDLFVWTPIRV
jgi:hypothetical protein